MTKILCVLYPDPEAGYPSNYIVMTGRGDVQIAMRAMKAGTHDFIEKPFDDEWLLSAIDQALALPGQVSRAREAAALSPREREVLDGLVAGKPNKVIGYDLGISVRTVEVHRARMLERLGARSTAEAIRLAVIATLAPLPLPLNSSIDAVREPCMRGKNEHRFSLKRSRGGQEQRSIRKLPAA